MKTAKDLMKQLEVTEQQANELVEVEAAYSEYYRGGTCTFKKWNDRIYITHSAKSATGNKKKCYYDLEEGILNDTYVRFEADRTIAEIEEPAAETAIAEEITVDYFNGIEWNLVNKKWLDGIQNIEDIEDIYAEVNDKVMVNYKNGSTVYYQNIHGTWGNATVFE